MYSWMSRPNQLFPNSFVRGPGATCYYIIPVHLIIRDWLRIQRFWLIRILESYLVSLTCSSLPQPQLPRCCEFRILRQLPVVRLGECVCVGRGMDMNGVWEHPTSPDMSWYPGTFPVIQQVRFLSFQLLRVEVWWLQSNLIFCLFGLAVPVALCQACTAGALCQYFPGDLHALS
jgi:hypothetical protein